MGPDAGKASADEKRSAYNGYPPSTSVLVAGSLPAALPAWCCGRPSLGGGFALRCFQRFSLPAVATRLRALGSTTGTPAGRPSRSSRTRERSPQASYAHGR